MIQYLYRKNVPEVLGNTNREIINTLIYDLLENSDSENEGYIAYSRDVEKALIGLRNFSRTNIYNNEKLTRERSKIERMYATLFETYFNDLESGSRDTKIVTDFIETGWTSPQVPGYGNGSRTRAGLYRRYDRSLLCKTV